MANDNGGNRRGRWQDFGLGGSGGQGNRSPWRFSLIYVAIAVIILFALNNSLTRTTRSVQLSAFFTQLNQGKVEKVVIATDSIQWTSNGLHYKATLPINYQTQDLVNTLQAKHVQYDATQPSAWGALLVQWVLPILFIAVIWIFLLRRMAGGGAAGALNLGKNRVKIYDRKEMKTTFTDVAGLDEATDELREIVDFLRYPKKYQRLGGRIPKGVLLLGPPGCGKTLLARAVAGEAGVPFFFMSGSEFVEMFVGLGAARVRELFTQAKEKAPCLVFLDELDTIGKSRAGSLGGSFGSHDEREQTLNQLLVEMDGFDSTKGVIIMAATNRSDVLDPALVRPGRFDRQVVVDRPDLRGREAILNVHTRGVSMDPNVDLRILASRTPGFTGADLANVVNEAALLAARREKDAVGEDDLEEAIDRTVAGLERKSRVMSEKEKVRVAVHEMGHAMVAVRVPHADPVHRVTIIPRGAGALGMTMQRPLEDRYLLTEPELLDRLAILLGGRTAEEIVFGEISTGAQNDLEVATDIARSMVVEFGMSPKLGPLSFGHDGFRGRNGSPLFPGEKPEVSEQTARLVDEEVSRLVAQAHERAREVLDRDRELLDKLSDVLIEREVIDGRELKKFVDGTEPIPSRDELKHESLVKASQNGHEDRVPAGPEIIASAPPGGQSDPSQVPARPD
jgi:cell division protease FtsH